MLARQERVRRHASGASRRAHFSPVVHVRAADTDGLDLDSDIASRHSVGQREVLEAHVVDSMQNSRAVGPGSVGDWCVWGYCRHGSKLPGAQQGPLAQRAQPLPQHGAWSQNGACDTVSRTEL